jgi:transposase-like protein
MKQTLIPGFPEGAQRIGQALSILTKDGRVTYFVGGDNFIDHKEGDKAGRRYAFACLMENGHVRAADLQKPPLSLPHRTLMNWCAQYRKEGSTSFFRGPSLKRPPVMSEAVRAQCASLLEQGIKPAEVARRVGIDHSTLRKAITRKAIPMAGNTGVADATPGQTNVLEPQSIPASCVFR